MLRFDDLLAARILHRGRPDLRRTLATGLRSLEGTPDAVSLLGILVQRAIVPRDEAEVVHKQVERWKRWRACAIYARLLVEKAKLQEAVVSGLVRSLGELADRDRLGEALLNRALVERDAETRLRFEAKLACDWELQQQVEQYRARQADDGALGEVTPPAGVPVGSPGGSRAQVASGSDTGSTGSATGDDLRTGLRSSGVFQIGPDVANPLEVTAIFDRGSVELAKRQELPPPSFPVPDWIDTANAFAGVEVGKYRIIGKIGAGAMATVYLADEGDRTKPYALKLVPPEAGAERAARFKREILANSFFSHPGVIDVYDAGVADTGHSYLAMEFFDGDDLGDILEAEQTLALRQALKVVRQVARALEAAHQAGIVHRDVKPTNILVSQDGTTAKLMDFGLALIRDLGDFKSKVFESDGGGVTGTPEYLSPEQACRDPLFPSSDLYALGLVLYRVLAGRSPFNAKSPVAWVQAHTHQAPTPLKDAVPGAAWPPALLSLLDDLLVKDPKKRVQTAAEVVDRIDSVFDGLGATRKRINPFRRGF